MSLRVGFISLCFPFLCLSKLVEGGHGVIIYFAAGAFRSDAGGSGVE